MKRNKLISITSLILTFGLGAAVTGCDDKKADESAKSDDKKDKKKKKEMTPKVDEKLAKKAKELEGQVKNARFPSEVTKDKDNAEAVVYLATSSEDADVRRAALMAMKSLYTTNDKDEKRVLVNDAYAEAVLKNLDAEEGKVQAQAIDAARSLVSGKEQNEKIIKKLVGIYESTDKPAAKLAVLDALRSVRNMQDNKEVLGIYVDALGSEHPFVVSRALGSMPMNLGDEKVWEKTKKLIGHEDPGVRGRAAEYLGKLAANDDEKRKEAAKLITPLLKDENNFTKSAAADGLAQARHTPAIHDIMPLLDNTEENRYDIKGFEQLDGSKGRLHHDGSAWSRVHDAALYALKRLSSKTEERFDYKINAKTSDEDLKKAVADAKAWYAKVKADIPKE